MDAKFLLNTAAAKKKGKIMEELSSLIMLHKNTTNSRM
jgi:hypothetical protein